jgi:pimeloyl-ACP methyl ester carboxylesterase
MNHYFIYKGKNINYYDEGKGDTIVLVHGYLESAEIWRGLAGKLSKKFRILSLDLPGHGLSDICGEADSMESMAAMVKELLNNLGIEKVFFTGHSLGTCLSGTIS